ncbi:hypothetical protein IscW_ISCW020563 [Ixodes scapularis]|uniref:Uncharacterized protein n=1 Tax=Ixodes scapularis TaxID=6945 RepID=B7Q2H5_IXOSC|nr:hypothetical protein IscW_ISCW020563 [Ixodes scapularis]|eukprot:XP_002410821.1 hypothetical protein IscW_ISCW020563 [Ixodes scapularis]
MPAPPPPPPPVPITPGTSRWLDSSARAAERIQQQQQQQQQQQDQKQQQQDQNTQRSAETSQPVSQPSTFSREISKFRNTVVDSAQNAEDVYGTNTFTKKSTISETGRSYDETTIRPAVKRLRSSGVPDDAVPSTSRGDTFHEECCRLDDAGNDAGSSASPIPGLRADTSRRRTSKSDSSTGDSELMTRPF